MFSIGAVQISLISEVPTPIDVGLLEMPRANTNFTHDDELIHQADQ